MLCQFRHLKSLKYLLLAIAACLIVASPSFALGADVMQSALTNMKDTQAWWDQLWVKTFTENATGTVGTGLSEYMFANVVRWVLALSLLFWVVRFVLNSGQIMSLTLPGVINSVVPFVFPFVIITILISNNAALAKEIPWAMRQNINTWRNGLMEAQITDLTIRGALDDQMLTQEAANKITAQAMYCDQMPHPNTVLPSPTRPTDKATLSKLTTTQKEAYNFIDCMNKLEEVAKTEQQKAESAVCSGNVFGKDACAFLTRFLAKTVNTIIDVKTNEKDRIFKSNGEGGWDFNPLGPQMVLADYLGGVAASIGFKSILNAVQWVTVSTMEMALWIDGLLAPIAVATGLVPGQLNLILSWGISFLSIGLAQFFYTAVVGTAALVLAQTTTFSAADLRFEMALGIAAPLVSTAVLTGGGFAAARAFTGQAVGLSMAAVNITTSLSTSIMSGLSRYIDSRR